MPTMKNPRSLFLQSANPRLLTSPNADVLLSASTPIFHVNNSGVSTPTIITLNASLIAMEGTVTFTCEGGTLSNIVGNTCALNYETLTGDNAKVVATITYRNNTYTDTVEISKVFDGANGVVGANNAVFYAWQRSATQPTGTPGDVQYSFPAMGITNTSLANGWQKTLPAGTGPLWITAATASGTGTTDNVAANEWSSAVLLGQDGQPGNPGINSAPVTIYQRTATTTAPALPSASTTYTFTPPGLTGLTNGWTRTLPDAANGKYLWASTATAANTTATDTIAVNEWAVAQILTESGVAGSRGNVQVARAIPGFTWSDSEAVLAISGAGYGTPQSRDIVTLYNNTASYSQQKYYDGSVWQVLAAYFPGSVIVDGTVDATKIVATGITADKIDARGLSIKDDAGNIILSAGKSLAEQTIFTPNLVENLAGWVRGGSAYLINEPSTAINGQSMVMPPNSFVQSRVLSLEPNVDYVVSFRALSADPNTSVSVDLYPDNLPEFSTGSLTAAPKYFQFNMKSSAAQMTAATLRFLGSTTGQVQVSDVKLERGSKATPWCDSVITKQSASTFIASAAINLAHIDKASIGSLSALSVNVGTLTSRVNGQGAGTTITGDQIAIYDEGGNLRQLEGRLW